MAQLVTAYVNMPNDSTILVIEPNTSFGKRLEKALRRTGKYDPVIIDRYVSIRHIEGYNPSAAIIGASYGLDECLKWVQRLKIVDPAMPVLVFSDSDILTGGTLTGPFDGVYSISPDKGLSELEELLDDAISNRVEMESIVDFPILIGKSTEIQRIRTQISRISHRDITVLITGESGTGKELIARSIHYHSPRRNGPLLKINCGAIPDDLLESEVFGFQQGAFTGAHRNKPGRLELAHGGTLFVDEIGDLSLQLQVKFLQVLEDKSFSRLGGVEDKIVDARVLAATNTNLWEMVRQGKFRKDLYYRLNVVHIEAPPLRRRREDIPLLADYFLNKYCYELKREPVPLPPRVLRALQGYEWPGNVRELENLVRRAIVMRDWDVVFKDLDLGLRLEDGYAGGGPDSAPGMMLWSDGTMDIYINETGFSLKSATKRYVSEVEKRAILQALKETRWNRRKAAELLGVSYKTLLNRIAEFNLRPT